tara:strand:+ start:626 stop:1009 length:384 start_codon:yes stop_codon:yes gene_type:complete
MDLTRLSSKNMEQRPNHMTLDIFSNGLAINPTTPHHTPQQKDNKMKTYQNHIEGYPTFIIWEGECYCIDCANKFAQEEHEDKDITEDERIFSRPGDAGISEVINWESTDLYCSSLHGCNERIEAAYE